MLYFHGYPYHPTWQVIIANIFALYYSLEFVVSLHVVFSYIIYLSDLIHSTTEYFSAFKSVRLYIGSVKSPASRFDVDGNLFEPARIPKSLSKHNLSTDRLHEFTSSSSSSFCTVLSMCTDAVKMLFSRNKIVYVAFSTFS